MEQGQRKRLCEREKERESKNEKENRERVEERWKQVVDIVDTVKSMQDRQQEREAGREKIVCEKQKDREKKERKRVCWRKRVGGRVVLYVISDTQSFPVMCRFLLFLSVVGLVSLWAEPPAPAP